MPWGNILINTNYVLNLDTGQLNQDIILKSINGVYTLVVPTKNVSANMLHKICVLKNNSLYYTLSDNIFNIYNDVLNNKRKLVINKYLKFEGSGTLTLYGTVMDKDINNNDIIKTYPLWSMVIINLNSLESKNSKPPIPPYSVILHPDSGKLVILDNGLNEVTSKELGNIMNKSINDYTGTNYNVLPELPNTNSFDDLLNEMGINNMFSSIMSSSGEDYMSDITEKDKLELSLGLKKSINTDSLTHHKQYDYDESLQYSISKLQKN
jgi:hypothetical protein